MQWTTAITTRWRLLLGAAVLPLMALTITGGTLASANAASAPHAAHARTVHKTGLAAGNPFCKRLGKRYQASAGARMFCFGPEHVTPHPNLRIGRALTASANVDAASFAEDVSPAGVQAGGQSETSIAASGPYVVEAWNDSTGFFSSCGSPMSKEELTGFGFSSDGGKSFTDLGGLPNSQCNKDVYGGDPSVAAYVVGGSTYFYISSLFNSVTGSGPSLIALDACKVIGSGSTATLSCGQPIIVGSSTQCQRFKIGPNQFQLFCSFVDKDFIAIDPAHGRLYATYTDFLINAPFGTRVEMGACDLGSPSGGVGPAGGTPAAPVCKHGTKLVLTGKNLLTAKPYFSVARPDPRGCENEGAYPAVSTGTGAVYVAFEYNIFTAMFAPCNTAATPTAEVMTRTPLSCLPLAAVASCPSPRARETVPIDSMGGVQVTGYSRFTTNDFPRLAVSDPYGTVSMVWNDAGIHPLGDILLQSFDQGTLAPIQGAPVVLNQPQSGPGSGGLHMFPAMNTANSTGLLDVSWYARDEAQTTLTNVDAVLGVNPRTTTPSSSNIRITSMASDWLQNSSIINPNFGDYIDEAFSTTGTPPYVGGTLYFAWSDGRFAVSQPFEAHLPG
jgi:hypothetical protein